MYLFLFIQEIVLIYGQYLINYYFANKNNEMLEILQSDRLSYSSDTLCCLIFTSGISSTESNNISRLLEVYPKSFINWQLQSISHVKLRAEDIC